jgi:DNA-binding NtrC family response regulator
VQSALSNWAIEPICCSSLQEARRYLPDETFSLIFCEDTLSDGTYRDILRPPGKPMKTRLVVISEVSDDQKYNEAKQLGAFDVISTPCRLSDIQWMVIRAIQEESKHSGARGRF